MTHEAYRAQYERRKADGLCVLCGRNPAEPGKSQCAGCNALKRQYWQKRKERCNAQRLCVKCRINPARPTMQKCAACALREKQIRIFGFKRSDDLLTV